MDVLSSRDREFVAGITAINELRRYPQWKDYETWVLNRFIDGLQKSLLDGNVESLEHFKAIRWLILTLLAIKNEPAQLRELVNRIRMEAGLVEPDAEEMINA